ncbi:MAG: glycoside hydrolase family 2 [Tannerella sp.]|nr:glycoside hydrolase family 2 [Tannerella sp.]
MMIKRCIGTILLTFASVFLQAQRTEVQYLSGTGSDDQTDWEFFCTGGRNSGEWTTIKVPSNWEPQGFGAFNFGRDKDKADEQGFYKTRFQLPDKWRKKRIYIVFEGSMTDTEVKINGRLAGPVHQGGYYRFKYEITSLVRFGHDNVLEVKVSKVSADESVEAAERYADYWVFGGIYRPVYLEAMPQQHMEYTGIDARMDGSVRAEINLQNPLKQFEAELTITDLNGHTIGTVAGSHNGKAVKQLVIEGKMNDVKPWSAEFPNLYNVTIALKQNGKTLHEVTDRIGFRTVEVRAQDGIYVNGEKIVFKGVNRASFWPATGRTTSRAISIRDGELIKEMNMNAVRMSHYPPDKHFLEVCDSLGLYVIDELCSWQAPAYNTKVGCKLLREMITRDVNHPSIVLWANGNEGGFNFDLDPLFKELDIQKRAVLHPWAQSDRINTVHYIAYGVGIRNMFNGREIFVPTEQLHGLYDGGHGAGLDDFWNYVQISPLSAGAFLWDFVDQGVVRPDLNGVLDTGNDQGADGIVGPYREKEGSFYTVKEIWSPVFMEKKIITPLWNGKLRIENRYAFTNTSQCTFSYELSQIRGFAERDIRKTSGRITSPDIEAGHRGQLALDLPADWYDYDVLYVTAKDPYGHELFTWSFEIDGTKKHLDHLLPVANGFVTPRESGNAWEFSAAGTTVHIDKTTGLLQSVNSAGKHIPLEKGPILLTEKEITPGTIESLTEADGIPRLRMTYTFESKRHIYNFDWAMREDGVLQLTVHYTPEDKVSMSGITFNLPEEGVTGVSLIANGPYRVYGNRMKGGTLNLWNKKYNNTITGESWDYPEFKGYYSLFHAMRLDCPTPFEVYCNADDINLHLFTPEAQKGHFSRPENVTHPPYPSGNLSFMAAIPPVGSKFVGPENLGPQSQLHRHAGHLTENDVNMTLYFKFQ